MSQFLIQNYLSNLDRIRSVSGSTRESVVREAFKDLLKQWGRQHDLVFIAEHEHIAPTKNRCYVDGALLHEIRVPFGYWEAKDTSDNLDEEIDTKTRKGYPQDNIIYEDSRNAVLIQNGQEIMRAEMLDAPQFEKLMGLFFSYERKEIAEFRKAVEQFRTDLPSVLAALRSKIEDAHATNSAYQSAEASFLTHAKETINPTLGTADVREMLIQHILTEEIFAKVFDESDFHQKNNIAKQLYALEDTFFTGGLKKQTLKALDSYYSAIKASAAQISNHAEKQTFLKVIYENFYKVYNEKAADRLGVVYTPNEIVKFMIQGADWLCHKYFSRGLADRNVEILDPATGTGTFITELLDYFRGDKSKLIYKYQNELHANEVAILPYYVANLNIESTFAAITGDYVEYENLCFVDTLDNVSPLGLRTGHQHDLFGSFTEENVKRVKRQNAKKISVIIGNPPYNANQQNENDNNKNREYPHIDALIQKTYDAASSAQKSKSRDMYIRFLRWASERLDLNGDGIVAFVTNRSFVDKHTLDGFRKTAMKDFNEIYVVDLKGDARTSGEKRRREGGNIFHDKIRVGIAISFFVRRHKSKGCRIHYEAVRDYAKADEKLSFISDRPFSDRTFTEITSDEQGNWLTVPETQYSTFLPVASRETKAAKSKTQERAIFKTYSLGISTNRDEWLYDLDRAKLERKVKLLIKNYSAPLSSSDDDGFPDDVKWSETLKRRKLSGAAERFDSGRMRQANYRPFYKTWLYQSDLFIDRPGQAETLFPPGHDNIGICFSDKGSRTDPCVLATDGVADLHFGAAIDGYQQVSLYSFVDDERVDNITDWALNRFREHYEKGKGRKTRAITKPDIFNYVYAVLHDPDYRGRYELNLKREFPRIPFYADFWKWADWGDALIKLHIGFETAEPFELERVDTEDQKAAAAGLPPKPVLRSNRNKQQIVVDSETTLAGVPDDAWDYMLGNRCGIDWVLEQHKERTAKDKTIRSNFDSFRLADHKETVIDLLMRVTTVSVETMSIVRKMGSLDDSARNVSN
ncbi:type ISP restriction/modification enzyme [Bradyrhizobium liaoningense]